MVLKELFSAKGGQRFDDFEDPKALEKGQEDCLSCRILGPLSCSYSCSCSCCACSLLAPKPWAWVLGRAGGRKNHKCDEEKEEEEERKITDRPVFLKIKVPRRSPLWADIRITPACNN